MNQPCYFVKTCFLFSINFANSAAAAGFDVRPEYGESQKSNEI